MTELQPTEIELTAKKRKPASRSTRKTIAFVVLIVIIALIAGFTIILANLASHAPETIRTQGQGPAIPAPEASAEPVQK